MNDLDLIFWGLVFVFAILGFFSGFWMQLMRLGALVGAWLLGGWVGKAFGPALGRGLGVPSLLGKALGAMLAFLVLYAVLSGIGWSLLRRRERRRAKVEGRRPKALWERLAGAGLGGAKVFLVLYLVLCALAIAEQPLSQALGSRGRMLEQSAMAGLAREHNLLAGVHLPVVGNARAIGKLATDPEFAKRALDDPKVQKLLDHPKIKALAEDRALVSAARRNDLAAVLANPRLNQVLEDPEIQKLLSEIDLAAVEKRDK